MKYQLHLLLITEIEKRFAKKADAVRFLMDVLDIEREAVYRRLRGDMPFSLQEASIIAKKLMISLDELIGVDLEKSKTFRVKLPDFISPNDNDRYMMTDFADFSRISV